MTDLNPITGLRPDTFGIARLEESGRTFYAVIRPEGDVIDISEKYPTTDSIYAQWDRTFEDLQSTVAHTVATFDSLAGLRVLPPTDRPQIFCAGSNYRQHAAEMYTYNEGNYQKERLPGESDDAFYQRNYRFVQERRAQGAPFIWLASHGSLIGPEDDIALPAVGVAHDWEAELCVVLTGGSPRYLAPSEAGQYIAGYTIGNDMHTGELFSRSDIKWNADWIAKQQPTFKQAGPFVVPRQFFPDRSGLHIRLDVNGATKQDWPADDMIFSPEEYIAYASERVNILAGDLLMMGSPPGNGAVHGQFLVPGDSIDISISGLGTQHHRVLAEPVDGRSPHYGLPILDGE